MRGEVRGKKNKEGRKEEEKGGNDMREEGKRRRIKPYDTDE